MHSKTCLLSDPRGDESTVVNGREYVLGVIPTWCHQWHAYSLLRRPKQQSFDHLFLVILTLNDLYISLWIFDIVL